MPAFIQTFPGGFLVSCSAKSHHTIVAVLLALGQEQLCWPSSCHMVPPDTFTKDMVGLSLLHLSFPVISKWKLFLIFNC